MNDGDARKNILSRVSPDMGDYGNGESNTGERERESRRKIGRERRGRGEGEGEGEGMGEEEGTGKGFEDKRSRLCCNICLCCNIFHGCYAIWLPLLPLLRLYLAAKKSTKTKGSKGSSTPHIDCYNKQSAFDNTPPNIASPPRPF